MAGSRACQVAEKLVTITTDKVIFKINLYGGDIVYAKSGRKTIIGKGIVTSDYIFNPDVEINQHIRHVNWKIQ